MNTLITSAIQEIASVARDLGDSRQAVEQIEAYIDLQLENSDPELGGYVDQDLLVELHYHEEVCATLEAELNNAIASYTEAQLQLQRQRETARRWAEQYSAIPF